MEADGQLVALANGLALLLAMPPAELAMRARTASAEQRHAPDRARLLCPAVGGTVLGIGMNYSDGVVEARAAGLVLPSHTIWFGRPIAALTGPYDPVWFPPGCDDLDYEGELVVVIGRRCHRVSAADAPAVIGGYTVGNDVTMRRRALVSAVLGKSYATHAPVGPVIVTPDEIGDPHALEIRTWLNGELRQHGNSAAMLLDCYAIVEALSAVMILVPGDLIFTGTPAGCGALSIPPRMLRPGDVVRIEIERIGVIENRVVESPPLP